MFSTPINVCSITSTKVHIQISSHSFEIETGPQHWKQLATTTDFNSAMHQLANLLPECALGVSTDMPNAMVVVSNHSHFTVHMAHFQALAGLVCRHLGLQTRAPWSLTQGAVYYCLHYQAGPITTSWDRVGAGLGPIGNLEQLQSELIQDSIARDNRIVYLDGAQIDIDVFLATIWSQKQMDELDRMEHPSEPLESAVLQLDGDALTVRNSIAEYQFPLVQELRDMLQMAAHYQGHLIVREAEGMKYYLTSAGIHFTLTTVTPIVSLKVRFFVSREELARVLPGGAVASF